MAKYFINIKPRENGIYEVHKFGCLLMPLPRNSNYIGDFKTTQESLLEAKKQHKHVNVCPYCNFPWHSDQNNVVPKNLRKS